MGNPNRLRQLFRKYDVDGNGNVSTEEFIAAMLSHSVPLSRKDAYFLAQVADTEDRGYVPYEAFIGVVKSVGASSKARQPSLQERSTDSISSVGARKASVASEGSVSSVRSSRSFQSVRSQRSTSSFAGARTHLSPSHTCTGADEHRIFARDDMCQRSEHVWCILQAV
jgi:hypothetical protein